MHGPSPPPSITLVYVGAFSHGFAGLISSKNLKALLETATRAEERSMMTGLINTTAVQLQSVLTESLKHPVKVEFAWDTIFPPDLSPETRYDVALTLGSNGSKNVVRPMIDGFKDIFRMNPESVSAMSKVHRVLIRAAPGKGGAEVGLTQDGPSPEQTLLYTLHLQDGLSGCLDKQTFKHRVRALFQMQTPKEDRGLGATLQSVAGGLDRAGDRLVRSFKKFL